MALGVCTGSGDQVVIHRINQSNASLNLCRTVSCIADEYSQKNAYRSLTTHNSACSLKVVNRRVNPNH